MKSGMLFWSLLVCAHTFTADQESSSGSYVSSKPSLSDEELLKKMQAAATPWWAGKDYEPLLIQVPGERRFYARVALRDGITGLLSGARKIDKACKNYWHSVKKKLEQHVVQSTTNHFGVILVPYQQ